ncbi:MAG: calcium-binding protein [Thermoleophilaceae bacterium]
MSWPIARLAALLCAASLVCASTALAENDPRWGGAAPSIAPQWDLHPQTTMSVTIGPERPFVQSMQWLRCDETGEACQPIPGATGETLTLSAFDIGHTFGLRWVIGDVYGTATSEAVVKYAVTPLPGHCTNRFDGTALNDTFIGSQDSDLFNGLAGNDSFVGGRAADCLNGGDGNDTLDGEDGNDTINGGPGDDKLLGGWGKDKIDGGPGNDRISLGFSGNRAVGGPGNDTINTANGYTDSADCGPGRDAVIADKRDRVRGCEKVRRSS